MPLNLTSHAGKFDEAGSAPVDTPWLYNTTGIFADRTHENELPPLRTEGKVEGIDRGFKSVPYASSGKEGW